MIFIDGKKVEIGNFPDGTQLLKFDAKRFGCTHSINWFYESEIELVTLVYLVKHIREHHDSNIDLFLPYIPNARMDRVKNTDEVFTLKYFCEVINSLNFSRVVVLDPHSYVATALLDRVVVDVTRVKVFINEASLRVADLNEDEEPLIFLPDEGSTKRYSLNRPFVFGMKKRDWETGNILGLDVITNGFDIKGKNILIVDDICSRGGTFLHSARKLKELGANKIYLYITHCENTILEGELLEGDLIEKVYTTESIFTKKHEKIEFVSNWRYI